MKCPNCMHRLAVCDTVTQPDRVLRRRICRNCRTRCVSVETLDDIKFPWRKSSKRQKK